MKYLSIIPISLILSTISFTSHANDDYHFSLGTGVPFLLTAELSTYSQDNQKRYYANAKGSFAAGAALGFEASVSENNKHAMGAFIGTVGISDGEDCPVTNSFSNDFACAIAHIFDWETVNGLGVTYSYNFNTLQKRGWKLRFEAGYGKGHKSKENSMAGNVYLGYQF
jgi:hypothetical protein